MTLKLKILAFLTPALLLLDQVSKVWVVNSFRYSGQPLPGKSPFSLMSPQGGLEMQGLSPANPEEMDIIPGFLSFIHTQNPGAAMGLMLGVEYRLPIFYAFTVVAVVVLLNMYKQLADDDKMQTITISLILSGALGNFIDRIHKSTVTDFVRVYTDHPPLKKWLIENFRTAEYPTWNVADAAIVVGVALYLIHYLFFERDREIKDAGKSPLEDEPTAP